MTHLFLARHVGLAPCTDVQRRATAPGRPMPTCFPRLRQAMTFLSTLETSMTTATLRPLTVNRKPFAAFSLLMLLVAGLGLALPGYALDLVAFTGITGPMTSALTQISALGPGIKALVGFVGFVVALISLSALRNFGPVLFYVGLAIFAAVGLVIAGAIMGAVV